MLFPACFNCSQKCYYVPYSLLSISNIFLWNQILILHSAFFTRNGVVSVAQERPLLPTLQNVHGALSSHHLLTPAFMGFSSLSLLTSCHSLWILFPAVPLLWGFVLKHTFVQWVLNIREVQTPRCLRSGHSPLAESAKRWTLFSGGGLQGTLAPSLRGWDAHWASVVFLRFLHSAQLLLQLRA